MPGLRHVAAHVLALEVAHGRFRIGRVSRNPPCFPKDAEIVLGFVMSRMRLRRRRRLFRLFRLLGLLRLGLDRFWRLVSRRFRRLLAIRAQIRLRRHDAAQPRHVAHGQRDRHRPGVADLHVLSRNAERIQIDVPLFEPRQAKPPVRLLDVFRIGLRVLDDPGEHFLLFQIFTPGPLHVLRIHVRIPEERDPRAAGRGAVGGDELEAIDLAVLVQMDVPAERGVPVPALPVDADDVATAHLPRLDRLAEVQRDDRPRRVSDVLERPEIARQLRHPIDVVLLERRLPGGEFLVRIQRREIREREAVVQAVERRIQRLAAVELRLVRLLQRPRLAGIERPRVERHVDAGGGERRARRHAALPLAGGVLHVDEHGAAIAAGVQIAQVLPDAHQLGKPAVDARGLEIARPQVLEPHDSTMKR